MGWIVFLSVTLRFLLLVGFARAGICVLVCHCDGDRVTFRWRRKSNQNGAGVSLYGFT